MPPRFAYWTILIDNKPTAFRARDPHELLPTLHQLRRTNDHVCLRWYAGGVLWESPEAARDARRTRARSPFDTKKPRRPAGPFKRRPR